MMYLALWGLLFAAPVLSMHVRMMADPSVVFNWQEVFYVWQKFAVYFVLFVIHNVFIAPLLVFQHRKLLYGTITLVVVVAFTFYQCTTRPPFPREMHHEMAGGRQQPPPGDYDGEFRQGPADRMGRHHDSDRMAPPPIVGEHDIVAVVVFILMFGMNVAIKGFFKTRDDEKKLVELEKQNLEQQLEYLKYQINPHFFMNTLNNIHALVDIDPEKAKDTIVELSKMMRFILYEGDKHGVPLSREFDFIRNYLTLMRLRYTDKVTINVELPAEVPDKSVPPLMLISFIENAFKHGISYQHQSFIDIKVGIEGTRLRFSCRNSKAEKPNQEKGGVGLANVKQRLQLLYDNNFTLNIQDTPETYNVQLEIPLL